MNKEIESNVYELIASVRDDVLENMSYEAKQGMVLEMSLEDQSSLILAMLTKSPQLKSLFKAN